MFAALAFTPVVAGVNDGGFVVIFVECLCSKRQTKLCQLVYSSHIAKRVNVQAGFTLTLAIMLGRAKDTWLNKVNVTTSTGSWSITQW